MKQFKISLTSLFILLGSVVYAQKTWYVSTTGDNDANSGSEISPWATIKGALGKDEVSNGDVITLMSGTYTEANIVIGKSVSIIGTSPANTIVQATAKQPDGNGTDMLPNQRVFTISSSVTLKNMSIRNGNISGGVGGGINVQKNATLQMEDCNVYNNYTDKGAGGVGGYGNAIIKNSAIYGNKAEQNGGGLAFFRATLTMENCVVCQNHSNKNGGAIAMVNDGAVLSLNNNTIVKNTTSSDARKGIYISNSTCAVLSNNILLNASDAGIDLGYDGDTNPMASATVKNNIVSKCWVAEIREEPNSLTWETTPAATETNVKLAPLKDNGNGLMSLALQSGSIAIDAGDAATACETDMMNTDRSGTPDIGAFEYSVLTGVVDRGSIEAVIAPNPSNGQFSVHTSEALKGTLDIYKLNGQLVYTVPVNDITTQVNLPDNINDRLLIKLNSKGHSKVYKHIVSK